MKSFLAVLVGLLVTIVLSVGVDVLLVSTGLLPPKSADYTDMHWAVITGYRVVIAIFGCCLAARKINGDTPHFLAKGVAPQ